MLMRENEHLYIKKIGDEDGLEVWLVDGDQVRRDLNENFTEYEHHARWNFIPANEIWIEKETNESEWGFFLENVRRERTYMKNGLSLEEAVEKANALEQIERFHTGRIQKILSASDAKKAALTRIHKAKLSEYSTDKFTVWLIDGEVVRALYMVDYSDGGHDLVYDWVPKSEIWIEEVLSEEGRKFIILHELHERFLMYGGKDYRHAHEGATIIEARYRKNPEGLEERIKEEMEKNRF